MSPGVRITLMRDHGSSTGFIHQFRLSVGNVQQTTFTRLQASISFQDCSRARNPELIGKSTRQPDSAAPFHLGRQD